MGSCRARSVYLTTRLLGRISPLKRLTSIVHILSPEIYIVKLGFTGVYIILLISAYNIDCGYLLELP